MKVKESNLTRDDFNFILKCLIGYQIECEDRMKNGDNCIEDFIKSNLIFNKIVSLN